MLSTTNISRAVTLSYLGVANPIVSVFTLRFYGPDLHIDYRAPIPSTSLCAVYYCAQLWNVSVTNGLPSTTTLQSWQNSTSINVGSLSQPQDYQDLFLFPPFLSSTESPTNLKNFFISSSAQYLLATYLGNVLAGNASVPRNLTGPNTDILASDGDLTRVLIHKNNPGDVNSTLHTMTLAMTDYLRQATTNEPYNVTGYLLVTETMINVRWPWMVLPVALVALATGFLVAVIWKSRGKVVWKSAVLAGMFHGFDGGAGKVSEMDSRARKMKVRLGQHGEGTKLVEVEMACLGTDNVI